MRSPVFHAAFLINKQYVAFMALGLCEFFARRALAPWLCLPRAAWVAGGLVAVAGQALRAWAEIHGGRAFTHLIRVRRVEGHRVVTSGPYALCRHPGYLGWALWATGTQVWLGNLISPVLFAATAYAFFRRRIPYEEAHLVAMFGDEYGRYMRSVWSGFPGIP